MAVERAEGGARLYTAKEAAARLGVEADTVRRWAREGRIGHVHVGPCRLVRLRAEDIEAAIHAEKAPSARP